jgi:hypothetical protein
MLCVSALGTSGSVFTFCHKKGEGVCHAWIYQKLKGLRKGHLVALWSKKQGVKRVYAIHAQRPEARACQIEDCCLLAREQTIIWKDMS